MTEKPLVLFTLPAVQAVTGVKDFAHWPVPKVVILFAGQICRFHRVNWDDQEYQEVKYVVHVARAGFKLRTRIF